MFFIRLDFPEIPHKWFVMCHQQKFVKYIPAFFRFDKVIFNSFIRCVFISFLINFYLRYLFLNYNAITMCLRFFIFYSRFFFLFF